MLPRTLGRSNIQVSAVGMGCWAIGGPFWKNGQPVGWSLVDDTESIRAIQRAVDLGVNFFDTADVYGCGHSECILGKALAGRRDQVVIATKFGQVFDEATKQVLGYDTTLEFIRQACDASLRRLKIDVIDLYQLHVKDLELAQVPAVLDALEGLVAQGKIRWYGWSTNEPTRARAFAAGKHCAAVQQQFNLFEGNAETLRVCEENNLACIVRGPLRMGLLTGKISGDVTFPKDDVRSRRPEFNGRHIEDLKTLAKLRGVLTRDGRTMAQAALGWLWARSEEMIPIPGFKTVAQVEENSSALQFGPLSEEQMKEIVAILN